VKCCVLKRCADRVRSRTDNKDEVLEGKFCNLNFSLSTKKTTEYSFELFLSIYRYLIFFLKFKTSTRSNNVNNRFAALVPQNHREFSGHEKMTFTSPGRVALGLPSPSLRVCTKRRTFVPTYRRTQVTKFA